MATSIFSFQAKIPAGTPVASPVTVALTMPSTEVVEVDIIVPPGPRGVMGFALGAAGQQVYPYKPGSWIITDNDKLVWQLEDAIDSGAWELIGYNTGAYDHTVYITFQTNPVQEAPTSSTPIAGLTGSTV